VNGHEPAGEDPAASDREIGAHEPQCANVDGDPRRAVRRMAADHGAVESPNFGSAACRQSSNRDDKIALIRWG
jgi:hypothetical protein